MKNIHFMGGDLSKDYKNYEENMKEYEKNKMENYEEEDDDFLN